jgi:methylenetetrahydrofolate dehydrogenase (NADP+)/methenyltetrahydrofolate cyclohydrolase
VPGGGSAARLRNTILALNDDPLVAGIIVQMPLPKRIPLSIVTDALDPAKDIDGLHPLNTGRLTLGYEGFLPTTAQAAVEILKRSGIAIAGQRAVVIGRSNVVGKPAAILLLRENATVTICHSQTRDLAAHVRTGDIVVVAVGKPGLITGSMLRRGAVVVDIGINVVGGRIVGDVDAASASRIASALTPVPGGVGPVTNALLMTHLMQAARRQAEADRPRSKRGSTMRSTVTGRGRPDPAGTRRRATTDAAGDPSTGPPSPSRTKETAALAAAGR